MTTPLSLLRPPLPCLWHRLGPGAHALVLLTCLAVLSPAAAARQPEPPSAQNSPTAAAPAPTPTPARVGAREEHAAAFAEVESALAGQFTDVQSVVVLLRGQPVYSYYRDGAPDALRATHSVAKSALSALVGIALAQGRLASLDQRVVELLPGVAPAGADPRVAQITVRHLLTMSAGFAIDDPTGTGPALRPKEALARPLAHAPGAAFAYDNSVVPLLGAVLERATGMPLADYARRHLVEPLGMAEPGFQRGLHLRTLDMARLGQLYLQRGVWNGRQIVPEAYVAASTRRQNAGGPPVGLAYGYLWWLVPSRAARPTFMASGFGGQFVWVYPPLDLVVAATSPGTAESARRGHALQLIRNPIFAAAQRLAAPEGGPR